MTESECTIRVTELHAKLFSIAVRAGVCGVCELEIEFD
jgi:hypothetical protein